MRRKHQTGGRVADSSTPRDRIAVIRRVITLAAAGAALGFGAVFALGASGFNYQTPTGACTYVTTEMRSDPPSGGEVTVRTRSQHFGSSACNHFWGRPAGQIAVHYYLWKWDGAAWQICQTVPILTNPSYGDTTVTWYRNYGANARCGPGNYVVQGFGQVYSGGAWRPLNGSPPIESAVNHLSQ